MTRRLLFPALIAGTFSLATIANANKRTPPHVLGHGEGLFKVGKLIAEDSFSTLDNWVVQLEKREDLPAATIEAQNETLDCFVPGRGCTIWFKKKLNTRITITYDVLCPSTSPSVAGILPRDINNFWLASDPLDPEHGLFDSTRYTGAFTSYNKMSGYYASTGGGKNTTTRMRRYPRERDGTPVSHIALKDKDQKPEFLIQPGKTMTVQLVAYDDVIQYIVDGKLNYEISRGDLIQIERQHANGRKDQQTTIYEIDKHPIYKEGFFGFRMVGTHHIYSNFRVFELEPVNPQKTILEVSSINELRQVLQKQNQHITMKPGVYEVTDLHDHRGAFQMTGSDNTFDFTGVTFRIPIATLSKISKRGRRSGKGVFVLSGDRITLQGGTFENIYPDQKTEITDFGSYNQNPTNFPTHNANEMCIVGNDILLKDCRFTVRGSFPYGYGNMYGIGPNPAVKLKKHCGIQITGDNITIDGCHVKQEAFGHAIYVIGGDQITVKNTVVEGKVRPSNDFYRETNSGDLPKRFDYKIQWPENVHGIPIPRDHMINLTEDGIRAYNGTGHMTVENCKVSKTRGGIKLYMAKSAKVSDCQVTDCVIQGYSIPNKGTITNSSGNAAYGPLLYIHSDRYSSQKIELEVLPAPHSLGDHPLAAIKGSRHRVSLTSPDDKTPAIPRPIIVGYPMRFGFLSTDFPDPPLDYRSHFKRFAPESYRATKISLKNDTPYPVIIGNMAKENKIRSRSPVKDNGINNSASKL